MHISATLRRRAGALALAAGVLWTVRVTAGSRTARSAAEALDLLLKPDRLRATLRT